MSCHTFFVCRDCNEEEMNDSRSRVGNPHHRPNYDAPNHANLLILLPQILAVYDAVKGTCEHWRICLCPYDGMVSLDVLDWLVEHRGHRVEVTDEYGDAYDGAGRRIERQK